MSRFRVRKNKGGFTLIEIMIVVLIIAILLAIAIPNFMRARETSRAKSCQANLRQIETAKEQCAMDNKLAADATPAKDALDDYMKAWPQCPSADAESYEAGIGAMSARPACANNPAGAVDGDYNFHGLSGAEEVVPEP